MLFLGIVSNVISPQYIYQGKQDLAIYSKFTFLKGFLNIIFIFLFIKNEGDYIIIPLLSVTLLFLMNTLLFARAIRKYEIKVFTIPLKRVVNLIVDEKVLFISTLFISLYTTTNIIIVSYFVDSSELGYFTASLSLLTIISSVISYPISTALFPHIGKSFSDSDESGLELIRKLLPIVFYVFLFTCTVLFAFSPIIIHIIYGEEFIPAVNILRVMAFSPLLIGISNIYGVQVMLNMKKDKLFFNTTMAASILGILLGFVLSSSFGVFGAAMNALIVEFMVTLVMYLVLLKKGISLISLKYFRVSSVVHNLKHI